MRYHVRKPRLAAIAGTMALVAVAAFASVVPSATGATTDDDRATPHDGNVTNCGSGKNGAGVGGTLAFANGTDSIDDGNVSGEVVDGTTVNVFPPAPGVTILAVIVKGGPGYNVYSTSSGTGPGDPSNHVPPTEPQLTEYVSPLVGSGNIPTVSHWFICYNSETPPDVGALEVTKEVTAAPGNALLAPPTSFEINVTCGEDIDETFSLAATEVHTVTDIPDGSSCVVTELGTGGFPVGSTVTIGSITVASPLPTDVAGDPVDVDGGDLVQVTVTNDFSGIEVQAGNVTAPPTPAAAVTVSPALTG